MKLNIYIKRRAKLIHKFENETKSIEISFSLMRNLSGLLKL